MQTEVHSASAYTAKNTKTLRHRNTNLLRLEFLVPLRQKSVESLFDMVLVSQAQLASFPPRPDIAGPHRGETGGNHETINQVLGQVLRQKKSCEFGSESKLKIKQLFSHLCIVKHLPICKRDNSLIQYGMIYTYIIYIYKQCTHDMIRVNLLYIQYILYYMIITF